MKSLTAFIFMMLVICAGQSTALAASSKYCEHSDRVVGILIDRTSSYDDIDRRLLADSLPAIDRQMVYGTRVVVQTIGEGFSTNRSEFDECVPGCPEESLGKQLIGTACVAAHANSDRTVFKQQLYTTLRRLSETPEAGSKSDIARTIVEMSRSLNTNGHPLSELVIFSDMIDNVIVPHRAIYTQAPTATLQQAQKVDARPKLDGTNVSVFGFGRSDIPPRAALKPDEAERLRKFWSEWLKAGGARSVSLGVRLQ